MNCINCGQEATGKFCSNCGQRTTVKKITWKETWFDFWSRVYGFDGMFPRTLRDLTIRPGVATKRYIDGNRVMYYGPVGYFFLMITLYLLVLSLLDLDLLEFMKGSTSKMGVTEEQSRRTAEFQRWITDNFKLFMFLLIPVEAFTARYIFFRKSGYNFLENTIIPFYVRGHIYWFSILGVIGFKITGNEMFTPTVGALFVPISVALTMFYYGLSYSQLMTHQGKVKAFLKGIGTFLTAFIIFVSTMGIVVGVVTVILTLARR